MRQGTLLLLGLAFMVAPRLSAQAAPLDVVAQFLALDATGARLHSSAEDPIWRLTIRDGEPPKHPIVLVDACRPLPARPAAATMQVRVRCTVSGTVTDDGTTVRYRPGRGVAGGTFTLLKEQSTWKISLGHLSFPPHVTPAAYLEHLDTLIHLYSDDKDKDDPRYRSLLRVRKSLQPVSRHP